MAARVLRVRGSKMSILEESFPRCNVLCTFDDVINFNGKLGKPKIGSFLLNFSLNVMSKFRVPEMTFRGQF